jgi:hypothetical protein
MNNVCFIIAMKYFRRANTNLNSKCYIKFYVDNIKKFYQNNLILIIDNNSENIIDIQKLFLDYDNLKIITNNSNCKFEIGAYNLGINYITKYNLIDKFSYFVFTQDNFVLNKMFNFNNLFNNNIYACAINIFNSLYSADNMIYTDPICINIVNKIRLQNRHNEFNLCWCNSFVLHNTKIIDYFNIVKNEIITKRSQGSEQSERYLSAILYYLNNYKLDSIDGSIEQNILGYDCWKVNIETDNINRYFIKHIQQKNENTKEIYN